MRAQLALAQQFPREPRQAKEAKHKHTAILGTRLPLWFANKKQRRKLMKLLASVRRTLIQAPACEQVLCFGCFQQWLHARQQLDCVHTG